MLTGRPEVMEGTPTIPRAQPGAPALTHDQVEAVEGSSIAVTPETQPPTPGHSRLGPLRHRDFRNVWLGAFGTNIGGWMEQIGVQWVVVGYTLAFGTSHGGLIGGLDFAFLRHVGAEPKGTVPHLAFCAFQMMFAFITPALIAGAYAVRMGFAA